MHVVVAIATFSRPIWLGNLLDSLAEQRLGSSPTTTVEVVVADNDAGGSARTVVDARRETFPWPLRYVREEERGISQARNSCVRVGLESSPDYFAFIDDDETASPDWLNAFVSAAARWPAAVLIGPVDNRYEKESWVTRAGALQRPHHEDGAVIHYGNTGNAFIPARPLAREHGPFDERFSRTGSEDTHLMMRLQRRGLTLRWCAGAVVTETVPESRTSLRWVLQREFRKGSGLALCETALATEEGHRLPQATYRGARGIARILKGLVLLPARLLQGRRGLLRTAMDVAAGLGTLAALLGIRYEEYRKVHGR